MKKISENIPALAVAAFFILGAGLMIHLYGLSTGDSGGIEVRIPTLSAQASTGKVVFDANCAQCHGANGSGGDAGPPLVHDIYNPGHHGDGAFYQAARRGVRRDHWGFDDMPPQPQVGQSEISSIIRYVRELQVANGIVYKPHNM
jgi:mono/diheme cytochrome c family protein